jgi:hypothetical protein
MSVQEYQLDAVEAEAKTDFIVDASVLEEIVLLRLSSGNIRLLHLVQARRAGTLVPTCPLFSISYHIAQAAKRLTRIQ